MTGHFICNGLLYTDCDALAVRRGHPAAAKLKRRDAFAEARHVAVIIRGQNEDLIDGWLRTKGLERKIALVVPGYIEALHVAARTDLVAFVPQRLIRALSKQLSLVSAAPPLDPGIDEQFMFYPTRAQMDPGSIWLRKLMLQTGRELDRGKRKAAKLRRLGKGALRAVPTIYQQSAS
jgi:DNA-binding transcriptional LysR family regulator